MRVLISFDDKLVSREFSSITEFEEFFKEHEFHKFTFWRDAHGANYLELERR